MPKTNLTFAAALSVASLLSTTALTADREHGAHVHGVANMNIAIFGEDVAIEFISPSANIVGFEHKAEAAEDKAAIKNAIEKLMMPSSLINLPAAAKCEVEDAHVDNAQLEEDHHDEHAHEDEHKHDDHHDHDEHAHEDEHKHDDHHDHENGEETHSEFQVSYHLHCHAPAELQSAELTVFKTFPGTEEVDLQLLTERGQTAKELTASNPQVKF